MKGSWFSSQFAGTAVPTLEDTLSYLATTNLTIMFDLFQPNDDHPYHFTYRNLTIDILKRVGMPESRVMNGFCIDILKDYLVDLQRICR